MNLMNVSKFLLQNVKPVLGCTDPVTVGYGISLAYRALYRCLPPDFCVSCPEPDPECVKKITIHQDRDSYKNGVAIAIPGTDGQKGTKFAAALGLFLNPSKGLSIFEDVSDEIINRANRLIESEKIVYKKNDDSSEIASIDVRVQLEYLVDGKETISNVRIQVKPDAISEIKICGKMIYEKNPEAEMTKEEKIPENVSELIAIARGLNKIERAIVYEGLVMNKKIAMEGLSGKYGLGLGQYLSNLIQKGILSDNLVTRIRVLAAAAGDARMGGANMPVMSTAGSGNQGITGLIPIIVVGEEKEIEKERIIEAAMLVHLLTKLVLNKSSYLSAICGCAIKAGIGATAGVTYLLGGTVEQIGKAINIMASNITGMICDGAKAGCALKLSTAAGTATESAFLIMEGMEVPTDNGILGSQPEETMRNIGDLSRTMVSTDVQIVRIMQEKMKDKYESTMSKK